MPAVDEPAVPSPLSWRDVYAANREMEERLMGAIGRIESKLDGQVTDHEQRLRRLEADKESFPPAVRRDLIADVAVTKAGIADFKARERGVFSTLRGGQQTLITLIAVVAFVISVLNYLNGSP